MRLTPPSPRFIHFHWTRGFCLVNLQAAQTQLPMKKAIFCAINALLTASLMSAPVTFNLVENESIITISGNVAGFAVSQQAAGSLVTHYTGTILADLTESTLHFTGGSAIDAKTNGVWQPMIGGGTSSTPGSDPGDYGGQANAGFATLKAAVRDVLLDVTTPAALPLNNGTFDASALTFKFPTNATSGFDYNAGALGRGNKKFGGLLTNRVSVAGTLTQSGGQKRLVIAVETDIKFTVLSQNDSTVHLSGQLVATEGGGGPAFSLIAFGTNNTLTITVEGAGAQPILESSTDLINWTPRSAQVTSNGTTRTYSTVAQGLIEFFRLRQ